MKRTNNIDIMINQMYSLGITSLLSALRLVHRPGRCRLTAEAAFLNLGSCNGRLFGSRGLGSRSRTSLDLPSATSPLVPSTFCQSGLDYGTLGTATPPNRTSRTWVYSRPRRYGVARTRAFRKYNKYVSFMRHQFVIVPLQIVRVLPVPQMVRLPYLRKQDFPWGGFLVLAEGRAVNETSHTFLLFHFSISFNWLDMFLRSSISLLVASI